jgi:hypothetical protein
MCERVEGNETQAGLEARYANYFKAGFTSEEVVIDLGQGYEDEGRIAVHTRIVTSPAYARDLAELLQAAVDDYENAYGAIPAERRVRSIGLPRRPPTREKENG